jgi:hypothetical protein
MSENAESTDIDFGPLTGLLGTWKGDKGRDVAPEPDGSEENPYYETLTFEPVGEVTNAERQKLVAIRYLQIVYRKSNDEAFHNETGYWMWDAQTQTVMHSLVVPRAVCVLAGGKVTTAGAPAEAVTLEVAARLGDPDWGIVQSPFMRDQARTVEFRQKIQINGDRLSYAETVVLEIYGRTFDHTDENELTRC